MSERIQKALAAAGLASRRQIETWITEGRIKVNGEPAKLGDRVIPSDRLTVDGRRVRLSNPTRSTPRVIAYHKTIGEVCARSDPDQRPTVFDRLPGVRQGRWIAVGRLDLNTCGLMLFTTDGELANALMHPSTGIEREYAVRVLGEPKPADLRRLTDGVTLDDGPAHFDRVTKGGGEGSNQWYRVVLQEGRKREVRRLWEAIGLKVSRLIRTKFGPIVLERGLPRGKYRQLAPDEVRSLYEVARLMVPQGLHVPETSKRDNRRARDSGRSRSTRHHRHR